MTAPVVMVLASGGAFPSSFPVRPARRRVAALVVGLAAWTAGCGGGTPTSPSVQTTGAPALTISANPQSQTVEPGGRATLEVQATGAAPMSYQWFVGESGQTTAAIDGATSASYTTPPLTETTRYWARLSNGAGAVNSRTATVTVAAVAGVEAVAPTIVEPPESQSIVAGRTATLFVEATGTGPLTFQWYAGVSGDTSEPMADATGAQFATPALAASTSFWVRVSNAAGHADSAAATVTVTAASPAPPSTPAPAPPAPAAPAPAPAPAPTPTPAPPSTPAPAPDPAPPADPSPAPAPVPSGVAPSIASHPASTSLTSGQSATLEVSATGTGPFTYQWYAGASGLTGSPIAGATAASFTTPALSASASYWARVSNAFGFADSHTATVTVAAPAPPPPAGVAPMITSQPQSQTIASGASATLQVSADGTGPLSYQWYQGATGATGIPVGSGPTYTTPGLSATRSYWVRVTNGFGAADSATATVTVTPPPGPSAGAFEDEVLVLINQIRATGATCGGTPYPAVGPLTMDASLRASARGHSEDMAAQNYFSHTSLDGRTFDVRIREAGYGGSYPLGENIAAGQSTPASVVSGWMSSTGHCQNIMNGSFRSIGVGFGYSTTSTYRWHWTQDFGGS